MLGSRALTAHPEAALVVIGHEIAVGSTGIDNGGPALLFCTSLTGNRRSLLEEFSSLPKIKLQNYDDASDAL
jgi:hypothetical protein